MRECTYAGKKDEEQRERKFATEMALDYYICIDFRLNRFHKTIYTYL
jgi:hypothetical protein